MVLWVLAGVVCGAWMLAMTAPAGRWWLVVMCLLLAARDIPAVVRRRSRLRRLNGQSLQFIGLDTLKHHMQHRPDAIFLGRGFTWAARHTELTNELKRQDLLFARQPHDTRKGSPALHGLGDENDPVFLPIDAARGHTLIVGTTGAGKTRMLEQLVAQAILRNEAVIVFDPKGDLALATLAERVCAAMGTPERFRYWHRAHPDRSIRLDPLCHFDHADELASRIAGLARVGSAPDVFSGFAHKTFKLILDAQLALGEPLSLKRLLFHVEQGSDALLGRLLQHHFQTCLGNEWRHHLQALPTRLPGSPPGGPLKDLVQAWRALQRSMPELSSPVIDGLIALGEHDRTHAQKLLAGILPILHMLCAGATGALLSPPALAEGTPTRSSDFAGLIGERAVLYVGLDSLSDPMVGAAVCRLLLADLASLAGRLQQHAGAMIPVNCYIDEAAECLGEASIALLNKGRSAGFSMTLLTQTFADFVAATGSEPRARQILANTNNLICLRIRDAETRRYVADLLPMVPLRQHGSTLSSSATADSPVHLQAQGGDQWSEQSAPMIEPSLFGALPDLESFVQLAGGQVFKMITPILTIEQNSANGI